MVSHYKLMASAAVYMLINATTGGGFFCTNVDCNGNDDLNPGLSLHTRRISGTLPPLISRFRGVETLTLYGNRLSGTLPTELGRLTSLSYLGLGANSISGTVPSELGSLSTTLTDGIYLWRNRLSGTLPSQLAQLQPGLCSLSAPSGGNCFRCPLPPALASACAAGVACSAAC